MKGDFIRNTFNPLKHFSRVLMQQGRVQLDADWNEQAAILLHYLRVLAADLIGPHGGPVNNWGFAITPNGLNNFRIGSGHYYINGILCEIGTTPVPITVLPPPNTNQVQVSTLFVDDVDFQESQYVEIFDDVQFPTQAPTLAQITDVSPTQRNLTLNTNISGFQNATAPKIRRITTYLTQPDYPVPDDEKLQASKNYLIYLDVWERHITYIEDDGIREVALGGPDTATRAKVVWQVKVRESASCGDVGNLMKLSTASLRARAKQDQPSTDPCVVKPKASYRGAENQLYRVEIHRGGSAWDGTDGTKSTAATFKWSRENGSVVFPILDVTSDNTTKTTSVSLAHLGRDMKLSLAVGDWVEIVDDDYVLQNRAEPLLKVFSIDRVELKVTLNGTSSVVGDPTKHQLLRRWDHKAGDPDEGGLTLSNGAALIVESEESEDGWLTLEDGVQIQFLLGGTYRTGDYWLIPARTATGDVEWPEDGQGNPVAQSPHSIVHHYAPLAFISVNTGGSIDSIQDCRCSFNPLCSVYGYGFEGIGSDQI